MNTLNLYNYFHFGDLFFSRSLIKGLSEKFKINFYHSLSEDVFTDLPNVKEIRGNIPSHFSSMIADLDSIQKGNINTWMGVNGSKYIRHSNIEYCSYSRYMNYVKAILAFYDIPIRDYEYYIPTVNYQNLSNTKELDNSFLQLTNNYKKVVFVSTGPTLSNQSLNFNFCNIIETLSNSHPETLFLVTSTDIKIKHNVVCTLDVFPKLLDINYISQKINTIVGRSSGPYVYCLSKNNLQTNTKTFISFCNTVEHAMFYEYFKCKSIWSNNYNESYIINEIHKNIV